MSRKLHDCVTKGREAARKLSAEALDSCFIPWSGRAPYTLWPSQAATGDDRAGETVDKAWLETVADFQEHAEGPPLPKATGPVIAFGVSKNGGSLDRDCASVTWILFDNDAAGDLTPLLDYFQAEGIAYIAQRRGPKWHLHLPLARPIIPQEPVEAWKKQHVAQMEWVTGLFSELADLAYDIHAVNDKGQAKPIYGFDTAIPCNRVFGICYPYARRVETDEVPDTFWGEGRALDVPTLLAASGFEFSPDKTTTRTISVEECQGRLAALEEAKLIRHVGKDGKYGIICPWSTDITSQGHEPGGPTSTVLFPNGVWHCSHETCINRSWRDVDTWLSDNRPAAHAAAWRSSIVYNDKGAPKQSIHNVLVILQHDPAWRGLIRYDVRAYKPVITRDPPWGADRVYCDAFITRTAGWLSKHWGIDGDFAHRALEAVARINSYDPVVEYLESVKWDGHPRIDTWLVDYARAADTPYHREVGKNWLISAVARAFDPGCQADHMLVFEGNQGKYKTSALHALGGQWYAELHNMKGQKGIEALQGHWIIEMAELAATRGADLESLKAYLTSRKDVLRAAYGKVVETRPRRCVFAGSTNDAAYLDDDENRRFWPVAAGECDSLGLKRDRDQLLAEAVVRYHAGEKYHITDDALKQDAIDVQASRRYVNPWEDKIAAYLKNRTITTTHALMQGALGIETKDQGRHYKQVGRIINTLGWQSRVIMKPGTDHQQRYLIRKDGTAVRWEDLPDGGMTHVGGGQKQPTKSN